MGEIGLLNALVGHEEDIDPIHRVDRLDGQEIRVSIGRGRYTRPSEKADR
jgi:hypothetical protein